MVHTRTVRVGIGAGLAAALVAGFEAAGRQGGFGTIDPPAPAPLAGSALWQRLLLENPWPLVILLGAASVAVVAAMRGRGRRAWWGVVPTVAAAAVYALSALVETPGEMLRARTVQLVGAAARADAGVLGDLLAPDALLSPPGGGASLDRDALLERVREDLGRRYRVSAWAVLETQSEVSGEEGRTQVKVRVVPEATGFPNISWWRLGWAMDRPGVWRVTRIEAVSLTSEVREQLR